MPNHRRSRRGRPQRSLTACSTIRQRLTALAKIALPKTARLFNSLLVLAWMFSVAIEYGTILAFPKWRNCKGTFTAIAVSNIASYSVVAFGLLIAGFTI